MKAIEIILFALILLPPVAVFVADRLIVRVAMWQQRVYGGRL